MERDAGCVLMRMTGDDRSFTFTPELNIANCSSAVVTLTSIKPKVVVVVTEHVADVLDVTFTFAQVNVPTVTVMGERKFVPVNVSVAVELGSTIVGETPETDGAP